MHLGQGDLTAPAPSSAPDSSSDNLPTVTVTATPLPAAIGSGFSLAGALGLLFLAWLIVKR